MSPLFPAPPSLLHPETGTRAWLFDETATVVTQTVGALNESVGRFFTGPLDAELRRRWATTGRKVSFVHDWRASLTYETAARDLVIGWGRAWVPNTARSWIALSPDASPFIRIAAATGIAALRLVRFPVEQVDDLGPVIAPLLKLTPVIV